MLKTKQGTAVCSYVYHRAPLGDNPTVAERCNMIEAAKVPFFSGITIFLHRYHHQLSENKSTSGEGILIIGIRFTEKSCNGQL